MGKLENIALLTLINTIYAYQNPECALNTDAATLATYGNTVCTYNTAGNFVFTVPFNGPQVTVFVRGANGGSAGLSTGGQGGAIAASFSTSTFIDQPINIVVGSDGQSNAFPVGQGGTPGGGNSGVGCPPTVEGCPAPDADPSTVNEYYLGTGGGGLSLINIAAQDYLVAGGGGGGATGVSTRNGISNGGVVIDNLGQGTGAGGANYDNSGNPATGGTPSGPGDGCQGPDSESSNGASGNNRNGGAGATAPDSYVQGNGAGGGAGIFGGGGGCGGYNSGTGGGGSTGSMLEGAAANALTLVNPTSFQAANSVATVLIYYQAVLSSPNIARRRRKRSVVSLCDAGETACPTKSGGFECFDTDYELSHCGGCVTEDPATTAGKDCLSIEHAQGVGCQSGKCVITSCVYPYRPSANRSTCVRY